MSQLKQIVVCAANRMPDGHLLIGVRHWDKLMRTQAGKLGYKGGNEEQGFVDQMGEFLTREEALQIAKDGNQIRRRCGGDEHALYSENLY